MSFFRDGNRQLCSVDKKVCAAGKPLRLAAIRHASATQDLAAMDIDLAAITPGRQSSYRILLSDRLIQILKLT